MRSGVGVVATGEVTVVGGDNGVLLALLRILSVPLTDAGSAGVGKDLATNRLQRLVNAITGNGGTDLL